MKKTIATAIIASVLASTAAFAQDIQPLDTTASTQVLPIFAAGAIPTGAIVIGGFVILGGVIIGIASDGT